MTWHWHCEKGVGGVSEEAIAGWDEDGGGRKRVRGGCKCIRGGQGYRRRNKAL